MANIKSSKKRAKTNEKRRVINVARRSDIKTNCKKIEAALAEKNVDLLKTLLRETEAKIARAQSKRLYKANTASRKISRLAKRVSAVVKG